MSEVTKDVIAVGHYVIIKKHNYSKVYKVTENGHLMLGKDEVQMHEIIGKQFWTTFEMIPLKNGKRTFTLKVASKTEMWDDLKSTLSSGYDNRSITDDGTSQKLSKEEISQLQESGKTGKEIIGSLIENSKSFLAKTEYSQEKYIKKKERKYFRYLTVYKPTINSLHDVYFKLNHNRIGGLRMDTLAQLLSYSDVQSDGIYILYDSGSQGLPAAAMLNRIGANTTGHLINLHPGNVPQTTIIQAMNFSQEQLDRLITVNVYSVLRCHYQGESSILNHISTSKKICNEYSGENSDNNISDQNKEIKNGVVVVKNKIFEAENIGKDKMEDENNSCESVNAVEEKSSVPDKVAMEKSENIEHNKAQSMYDVQANVDVLKRKLEDSNDTVPLKKPKWLLDTQRAVDLLQDVKARGLIIIAKEHPVNIIKALLPFLGFSRPFVIYHNHREALQETYMVLKQSQNVINLRLFSNFLRSYQVLPDRTHPDILTSDTGGYLLTGYLVE